ncbi:relaxase domain-containing protein [Chroococcidiopsis sp. CCMEE 29]|uniref:relaxase domain-containing protein n=1 Tax=Chroococcidiopsis sp. CCMEE 29 TaxID=155894 RepID=UPI0020202B51|nr:relaxase domain-containing protein [Chroococcidiopsis sp. CCMEE 29]
MTFDLNIFCQSVRLGNLYRQKLAHKVQALGYEIYETKDGFELEGITRENIQVFSKRSRSIIRKIQHSGLKVTPENRDRATLTTRKAKHITQTLEEFQQEWKAEAAAMKVEIPLPGKPQLNLWEREQQKMSYRSFITLGR